jgi:hypothetical protein
MLWIRHCGSGSGIADLDPALRIWIRILYFSTMRTQIRIQEFNDQNWKILLVKNFFHYLQ